MEQRKDKIIRNGGISPKIPEVREGAPSRSICVSRGPSSGIPFKTRRTPGARASGARGSGGDLLSRARRPGTIGDRRLDFRVRNGNGYDPPSMTAEISKLSTGGKGFHGKQGRLGSAGRLEAPGCPRAAKATSRK